MFLIGCHGANTVFAAHRMAGLAGIPTLSCLPTDFSWKLLPQCNLCWRRHASKFLSQVSLSCEKFKVERHTTSHTRWGKQRRENPSQTKVKNPRHAGTRDRSPGVLGPTCLDHPFPAFTIQLDKHFLKMLKLLGGCSRIQI